MCRGLACSPEECCPLAVVREVHLHCAIAQRMGYNQKMHIKAHETNSPADAAKVLKRLRQYSAQLADLNQQAMLYVQWWRSAYHTTGADIFDSLLDDMNARMSPRVNVPSSFPHSLGSSPAKGAVERLCLPCVKAAKVALGHTLFMPAAGGMQECKDKHNHLRLRDKTPHRLQV